MILLQGLNLSPVKGNHAGPRGSIRFGGLRGTSAIPSNGFKLGRGATWTIGQPTVHWIVAHLLVSLHVSCSHAPLVQD